MALAFFQCASIAGTKLLTSLAPGFIGYGDPTFRKEFFHFTEAQADAMIQPDGVTNNFGRVARALVAELFGFHTGQFAKHELH